MKICKNCGLPRPEDGEAIMYSGPLCKGKDPIDVHIFEPIEEKSAVDELCETLKVKGPAIQKMLDEEDGS